MATPAQRVDDVVQQRGLDRTVVSRRRLEEHRVQNRGAGEETETQGRESNVREKRATSEKSHMIDRKVASERIWKGCVRGVGNATLEKLEKSEKLHERKVRKSHSREKLHRGKVVKVTSERSWKSHNKEK